MSGAGGVSRRLSHRDAHPGALLIGVAGRLYRREALLG